MRNILFVGIVGLLLLGAGCASGIDARALDFRGKGLTEVPADVFSQTDLVELDLSDNALTGSLPGEIRFLSKLEVLDVSDNAMTGVFAEIGQLSRLRVLDLSNNQLTGLPLEMGNLSALELLDLRGNAYSTYDLERIQTSLPSTTILVD